MTEREVMKEIKRIEYEVVERDRVKTDLIRS